MTLLYMLCTQAGPAKNLAENSNHVSAFSFAIFELNVWHEVLQSTDKISISAHFEFASR